MASTIEITQKLTQPNITISGDQSIAAQMQELRSLLVKHFESPRKHSKNLSIIGLLKRKFLPQITKGDTCVQKNTPS